MAVAAPRRITQQMRGDSPTHWERCNTACGPWAADGTAGTFWNIGISTAQKHFCATRPGRCVRDAALFFLDWLAEDPKTGKLVSGPSSSPENRFLAPGTQDVCNLVMGPSMDQQIIWETFTNCLRCAEILSLDDPIIDDIKSALSRLAEPANRLRWTPDGMDGRI